MRLWHSLQRGDAQTPLLEATFEAGGFIYKAALTEDKLLIVETAYEEYARQLVERDINSYEGCNIFDAYNQVVNALQTEQARLDCLTRVELVFNNLRATLTSQERASKIYIRQRYFLDYSLDKNWKAREELLPAGLTLTAGNALSACLSFAEENDIPIESIKWQANA